MKTKRAEFEKFLALVTDPRVKALRANYLKLADAYDRVIKSGKLTERDLTIVVESVCSAYSCLWQDASYLLAELAERWSIAADAVARLFQSPKAQVRFSALCCLTPKTPKKIADKLMCDGLIDKGSRVRWKAAQKVLELRRKKLLPQLEAAHAVEKNAQALGEITFSLEMLRDGYIIEEDNPSGFLVTAPFKRNGLEGYSTHRVTKNEMKTKGIQALLEEWKKAGW